MLKKLFSPSNNTLESMNTAINSGEPDVMVVCLREFYGEGLTKGMAIGTVISAVVYITGTMISHKIVKG